MLLRAVFILTFYFIWTTWALQCPSCSKTLNLSSSENISTAKPECDSVEAKYESCSQVLHVRYTKEEASIVFGATPTESLVLSNVPKIMTNKTMIWLDKFQFERTFQIFCFNTNACRADAIDAIYTEERHFKPSTLWGKLLDRLYDDPDNPEKLVCADNQDKPVSCPRGFCQLMISSDSSDFSRSCIHKGSIDNHYGVILESKTTSETDIQSSVIYTCNKPMCNNLAIAKEVRNLLEGSNLLTYSITTTTTTTTKSTTTLRSTGNIAKSMVSIQCGLIVLMTFIFQQ